MPKRPRDPNQIAKLVVDIATGEVDDPESEAKRNPSRRQIGGRVGGPARAKTLTTEQRRQIAVKAARARWTKRTDD